MNTKLIRINWLILLLGFALLAAGAISAITCLHREQETQAEEEAFRLTLDRLTVDDQLTLTLKTIHDGEVNVAAEQLERLLCGHIVRTGSELASTSARHRRFLENAIRIIALRWPKTADATTVRATHKGNDDWAEAQRILQQALADDTNRLTAATQ